MRSLRTQVRCLELGSGDPQTIEVLNRMVVSAENTLESCRALGALQDAIECYFQDHSDTLGVRDV